ncbi:MAG: M42 family peptidase [Candidatus Hydrogenedentes bacterium]|nr:M42 family peptidase [Candidatus Hydrogenedentota bacterium]
MNGPTRKRLETLLQTPSPSGAETALQDLCARYLEDQVGTITRDVHGNQYYPLAAGHPRRIMLCAHADEIGLMVQGIDKEGFLRVTGIGGVDPSTLSGQRVRTGKVPGVIGRRAIHLQSKEDSDTALSIDTLWIDIGARNKKEAERLVHIGDTLTLDTPVTWLRNDRVAARGLDNRIGVFILMESMRRLARRKLAVDIIGVTTVQEEIGLRGATTSSYQCAPHVAVNLDVNFATDHPDGEPERWGDTGLSKGPILAHGPGVNPRLLSEFKDVAQRAHIPTQVRAEPDADGTDAGALQLAHDGVAVIDIGIPNRYMHTAVEMICLHDVQHCIDLLTAWVVQCKNDVDYTPR